MDEHEYKGNIFNRSKTNQDGQIRYSVCNSGENSSFSIEMNKDKFTHNSVRVTSNNFFIYSDRKAR